MKKKKAQKLSLNRETLKNLQADELEKIDGGCLFSNDGCDTVLCHTAFMC